MLSPQVTPLEGIPPAHEDVSSDQLQLPPVSSEQGRTELCNSLRTWLSWQCQMISGALQGEIHEVAPDGSLVPAIDAWPADTPCSPLLSSAVARVAKEQKAIVDSGTDSPPHVDECNVIAQPVTVNEALCVIVAFKLSPRSDVQLRAVMQLLQWGVIWLETLLKDSGTTKRHPSNAVTEILQVLLRPGSFSELMSSLCDELSERYTCDRVSVGVTKSISTRLVGVTKNVRIVSHSSLQQDLEAAMTEACDLKAPVEFPDSEMPALCHRALARRQGMNYVFTQPLQFENNTYGAITMERSASQPMTPEHRAELDRVAPILGYHLRSLLSERYSIHSRVKRFGRNVVNGKTALLVMVGVIAALYFVPGNYRVDSDATVKGAIQQAVVAPIDGYIAEAFVRAGDTVERDEVLVQLQEFELNLERQKWQSEYERNAKVYVEALAMHQRAQSGIAEARMAETEAELKLIDVKLERASLRAPFSGIVVTGDLDQSLGTPVSRGQVLFEVAPLDNYRVDLEVSERDIAEVSVGQQGQLRLIGLPDQRFPVTVTKTAPIATAEDGGSYFRVEAQMDAPDERIRPGMQGITKLDVGQRSLVWIWTRNLWSRIRLWLWSIGI